MKTSLSVLVPVFNEQHLVAESLQRLEVLSQSPHLSRVQIIVVDDCSSDRTPQVLETFQKRVATQPAGIFQWIFLRHEKNAGKGGAVRTALEQADCEITVIHDADLEYHPVDLLRMVEVFVQEEADAVYGSRFAGAAVRRVLLYRHQLGNRLLTSLCNMATNLNLTDMETCYKAVRTVLLKSIPLESNDFRLEPELTIKLARRHARIFEVPISYSGRTYEDGKKIGWRDGVAALWAIGRFSFSDNIYAEDPWGSRILGRLSRARRFNAWMADTIRPLCGDRVLEIGAGVGNLTRALLPREKYVASDINPLYLDTLSTLRATRPYLEVCRCDVTDVASFPDNPQGFDTVICLNVLEHVENDHDALSNIAAALAPGGRAVVLVPQGPWNMGSLDRVLGHVRRYTRQSFEQLAVSCGLVMEQMLEFNRVGTPAWFLNGRILKRERFGWVQVTALDTLTPMFRVVDESLPFPPLSIIGVFSRATSDKPQPAAPGNGLRANAEA